jgi:MoxR-like ATPase
MTQYPITPRMLREELEAHAYAGTVPLFLGAPGIGKSEGGHDFADAMNLEMIDVRLSSYLAEDLNGLPVRDGDRAIFLPYDVFPTEDTPLPKGKDGWFLFLDEFTSMSKSVQAPVYKLLLDRMVGQRKLHKRVVIAAAGNRLQDRAVVTALSSALKSRVTTYEMEVNVEEWLQWASKNHIDERINGYINYHPSDLMTFNPESDEASYSCPRSLYNLHKLIKDKEVTESMMPRIAGTIGDGVATKFKTYCDEAKDLVRPEEIFSNPNEAPVPRRASTKYATILALTSKIVDDDKIIKAAITYIDKYDPEFQNVFYRTVLHKDQKLRDNRIIFDKSIQYHKEWR